jgi:hypothetical protein
MPNSGNITAPILVIGPGRSGSSWLVHALSQHPDVQPLIENAIVRSLHREIFHSWWAKAWHWECDDVELERRAIRTVHAALCELFPGEKPRWVMKMIWEGHPWEFAAKLFPEACYIHITRSPTTAISSMQEYLGKINPVWHNFQHAEKQYIAAHREALKLRDAGVPYLRIRQEDAAVDPHKVWEQVREFCGLSNVPVSNLTEEINTSASTVGRVKQMRPPLPWSDFSSETIVLCRELGYSPSLDAPAISAEPVPTEVVTIQAKKPPQIDQANNGIPIPVKEVPPPTEPQPVAKPETKAAAVPEDCMSCQALGMECRLWELKLIKSTKSWKFLEMYWKKKRWLKTTVANLLNQKY